MNCFDNNTAYTCGTDTPSVCVTYPENAPQYSELSRHQCLNAEEIITDLYKVIGILRNSTDLTELNVGDMDLDKVSSGYNRERASYLVKDVLQGILEKIKQIDHKMEEEDGSNLELDFKSLKAPCGSDITNLRDLLQALINEVDALKNNQI